MSRTIDERVVSMQFDNRQFENNVRTSLSTIEKLKQSLNFKSASKGLENINQAAKSCNLAPLSSAAESVKLKFSAMEVMAVTALSNITNSAVNAGKRIVSALTIDPIKTGLSEYETQIGAIQTILANTESKGTTLDDVNAALDELNTYADKTIYNFTQMTRNIGTFTAAGVGLDESTQAIKGIANLAAVSGSNAQQASTAMYQLSQALAAGRVSLMDWNSVVNAGMGGEVFQNALKRTSRMLGTGVDEAIKKYGTFRESLTQGQWLTKEVLVETLAQLSGAYTEADLIAQGFTKQQAAEITKLAQTAEDAATKVKTFTQLWDTLKESAQSGWTQTWEYIFGDFEESKWFFSNLSDTIGAFIGKSADSRNKLLGEALTSNYDKLIGKLKDAGVEATDFESKVKDVLKKHGYDVERIIEKYGSLGRAFTHGAIPASNLKEALADLGKAADISLEGIDRVLKKGTSGEDVKKAQKALKALGHDLGTFGEQADGVDGVLGGMTESAIKAFQAANGLEADGIIGPKTLEALEKASKKTKTLGKDLYSLIDGVNQLGGGELLRESVSNVVKGILNIFSSVKSAWGEVFNIEPDQIYSVLDVIHKFTDKFVKWTENNSDKIKMVFQGVFSVLGVAWDTLKAVLTGVWKIVSPILSLLGKGIFTAASALGKWLVGLRESFIESGKFAKITDAVANGITKVIDFVKRLGKPIWEWIFGSKNDSEGQLTGLQQFIDKIKNFISESEALAHIGTKLSNFGKKIKNYFANLFPTEGDIDISAVLGKVRDDIINFFKNFSAKDIITKIGNFFKEFGSKFNTDLLNIGFDFNGLKASIAAKFVEIRDTVINFFKNFSFEEAVAKLKENFSKIGPAIKSIFDKIAEMFGVSKEKFESIREKISDFFGGIFDFLGDNKGSIAALGIVLGIITMLVKIKNAISKIAGIFEAFDDIKGAFEALIESKKAINQATANKIKTESVKNIAIAIGILATSLFIISKIPKEDLLRAGATLTIITGVVIGLIFLLKFVNKNVNSKTVINTVSFGAMMASLGTALILMTVAIKLLGGMDPGELKRGGLAIAAFFGMTALLMKASNSIGEGKIKDFGKMMKQLGVALLLLSASVYIFGKMNTKTLIQGGLAVTYFLGIMAGIMAISGILAGDVRSFGKMIRSLSISLLLLAGTVYIFGKMDTKTLIQGGLAVTAFLGIMMGVMVLSRKVSKDVASFGKMMLGIGASLLLMAWAVKIFGGMDIKTIAKGTIAIGAFAGIIVGLMAATKLMGKYSFNAGKMGLMILSFATSMLIMAGAVAALSMIEGKDLAKALAAIGGIGLIFAGLLVVTKYAKSVKVGTIIALSAAVAIMAGSVAALSFVPKEKLINATACLGVLMGMLSLLAFASKFAKGKSLLGLAGMAIIFGGIGILFAKMTEDIENADSAVSVAKAIGILVTALSASALLLSKIGEMDKSAITSSLIIFGALAIIVGGLTALAIWQLPNIAKQLSKFMTELQPFISGMSQINYSMVKRIKILGEAMGAFAGAGAKFALTNLVTFGGVSRAFGAFVNFISQIVPVIKDAALETSGVDIDFTNLDGIINAVGGLAEAAANVPTNTIGFALTKWGGGAFINVNDLYAFTTFVTSVIPIVEEFAIAINDAKIDSTTSSVVGDLFEAIGYLAEAADKAPSIEAAGGLAKFKGGLAGGAYVSVPDLYSFTNYVKEILKALEEFLPGISGIVPTIPVEFITGIFDGIKKLAEAAGSAPTVSAGIGFAKFAKLWGIFGGGTWTDMDEFRKYLVGDGKNKGAIDAVKEFINGIDYAQLEAIDAEKIDPILNGIANITTAIAALGKSAEAAGETTVAGGIGAGKLGFGVGAYYTTTNLEEFKNFLLGDDGLIAGVNSFITGMLPVMDQLNQYDDTTITAITDGISNIVTAVSTLASACNAPTDVNLDAAGGFGGLINGLFGGGGKVTMTTTTDLEGFKTWLIGDDGKGGMMAALTGFVDIFDDKETLDAIKKIGDNTEGFNTVISVVDTLAGLAEKAPKQVDAKGGIGGALAGITGAFGGFVGAGEYHSVTDLDKFKTWITEVTPVLKGFVIDASGITIPEGSAIETVIKAIDAIASAANSVKPKTSGWAAGFACIAGVPVGIIGHGGSITDYDGFVRFVTALGGSDGPLVKLVTAVNGLTFDASIDSNASQKLTTLLTAVDTLASASTNIPNYSEFSSLFGILATYESAPDFTGFSNWITSMTGENGEGGIIALINDANDKLPGEGELDPSKIANLCYVVDELAKAASVIPDTSLWGEIFGGVTNFDGFSTFVDTIGTEVVNFAETISDSTIEDIDLSKILALADVLKILAEVGNLVTASSYVDVTAFGLEDPDGKTPIDYIVEAVVNAKDALGELNESDLAALETAANAISAFSQVLVNISGQYSSLANYTADATTSEQFKAYVTDVATTLTDFTKKMEGVNLDRLNLASTAAQSIATALTKLAAIEYGKINIGMLKVKLEELATAIDTFATSISENTTLSADMVTLASDIITGFTDTFANAETDISAVGSSMITAFISGVMSDDCKESISVAFDSMADSCATAASTQANIDGMTTAGKDLANGLISGINAKKDSVYWAAYALGQKAVQGEKDGQASNSPSKETIKAGKWLGEGLVIGIRKMSSAVYNSGKSMGEVATDSISKSIQTISDFIDTDIDNQPTIRPILDLSEVEAGANGISDMFGVNPSVALMSNVGSINSMMNNRQNGTNSDILSAIKDLGRSMSNRSGDTYTINGITYDDGSNVSDAVKALMRAARIERRT